MLKNAIYTVLGSIVVGILYAIGSAIIKTERNEGRIDRVEEQLEKREVFLVQAIQLEVRVRNLEQEHNSQPNKLRENP